MPFGARPSTGGVFRFHHGRVSGERIALPSPRCERGILLLEEPDEFWMRDSELHGACVLMKHARRLRLPSRNEYWWAWEELHLHAW